MNEIQVNYKLPWGGYLGNKTLSIGRKLKDLCHRNFGLSCFLCGNNFFAFCILDKNGKRKGMEKYKNIWYTNNVLIIDRSVSL